MQTQSPSEAALERACERLLAQQDPEGFWHSELQTNVTMDAEDILLREFLGIRNGRADGSLGRVDPLAAARRRNVGELPRRAR